MENQKDFRRPKSDAFQSHQSRRIEWARSLSNAQMEAILQDGLLKARAQTPRTHQVILTEEIVHELKSRLMRYDGCMGPPPPVKKRYEEEEESNEDE